MQQVIKDIIQRLSEPVKKKFPYRYELELRKDLLNKLAAISGANDKEIVAGLKSIEGTLSRASYESTYAYQRLINNEYLKAFKKFIPANAEQTAAVEPVIKSRFAYINNRWVEFKEQNQQQPAQQITMSL